MSTRLQHLARRLWDGSGVLARRRADAVAAWVRRGRRDDLTGVPAILGCWLRALLVLLGGYLLWRLIRAAPGLLWLIVPVWCWRAVRAVPSADDAESVPDEGAEASARDDVLALLFDILGDRPAVHLSEVLQHLQKQGRGEGWTVTDLRARLEALDIPVAAKVKAGGKSPTRGVRKSALLALSPETAPEASTAPSTAA
ncbi:hypothetical protein [Streptomyces scopuliridis]|uniref:Uncharacterized protein n=1 Tax=Streptomyces scopuliridis TaxID=452529 RepID=A0ACD4ZPF9_9ACTN|nr:hypothetical protein [Streptomyces scopuliridis]WSC00079.1 hypothetical protein OG835_25840 [Streptomyces scopuliridis]